MLEKKGNRPPKIQVQHFLDKIVHRSSGSLSQRDSILFSLAIGFNQGPLSINADPLKQEDYRYTNENDPNFMAFPTVVATLHHMNFLHLMQEDINMPTFNPYLVLHVEQILEMVQPQIQIGLPLEHVSTIVDVMDKGKNAQIWVEIRTYVARQNQRQLVSITTGALSFKGLGGFGYKGRNLFAVLPEPPTKKPDLVKIVKTFANQAFYFRMTGDRNPLHIHPQAAKSQNFTRPILHGMATYGSIVRVFIQQLLDNDARRFKAFHTRFVGYVYPGETLTLNLWRQSGERYFVEAIAQERNTKVIIGRISIKTEAKL